MKVKHGALNESMKFVVTQVKNTEEISLQIYVKVGSRDESKELSGISHLLEHMFFQGSMKYPTVKDLEETIYKCGGNFNAFTSNAETVYHIECVSKCVEDACDIASDAFYRSLFDKEKLENEKKVVLNELKEYQSNPKYICAQGLQEIAFKGTLLDKDIGGNPKAVRAVTVQKLKNYVSTHYNGEVVVSLTSKLPLSKGEELLKQYFSEVAHYECTKMPKILKDKKRKLYPDHWSKKTHGDIRYTHHTGKQSFIAIAFPSVKYTDVAGQYTMKILSEILTGYMSSYLYQELRHEKGLIYHVDSGSEFFEDMGIFRIHCATENTQDTVIETIETITSFLDTVDTHVSEDVLDSAQSHLSHVLSLTDKQVHKIGFEATQDLVYLGKVLSTKEKRDYIKGVTLKDIREMASKIFKSQYCFISYTGSSPYL